LGVGAGPCSPKPGNLPPIGPALRGPSRAPPRGCTANRPRIPWPFARSAPRVHRQSAPHSMALRAPRPAGAPPIGPTLHGPSRAPPRGCTPNRPRTLWPFTCSANIESNGGFYDRSGWIGGFGGALPSTVGDGDATGSGTLRHTGQAKWTQWAVPVPSVSCRQRGVTARPAGQCEGLPAGSQVRAERRAGPPAAPGPICRAFPPDLY
jgi:hypothetical protein